MAVSDPAVADPAPAWSRRARLLLAALALLLIVLFAGLGTWQVMRLQWKLDLIARVDARVHAAPAAPPSVARWAGITAESDEYRRVQVSGTYLYEYTTPVQALTEQGGGYWLLTPLCTPDGHVILVNRGFIPADPGARTRYEPRKSAGYPCATVPGGAVQLVGLLRISEPAGPSRAPTSRWTTAGIRATSPPSPPRAACRPRSPRRSSSTPPPARIRPVRRTGRRAASRWSVSTTATWCMPSLGMLWP
jgi:cytochrome oxidase assembly protein ShyY1